MPETSRENVVAILERAKLKDWVLGTTKVIIQSNTEVCNYIIVFYQANEPLNKHMQTYVL